MRKSKFDLNKGRGEDLGLYFFHMGVFLANRTVTAIFKLDKGTSALVTRVLPDSLKDSSAHAQICNMPIYDKPKYSLDLKTSK